MIIFIDKNFITKVEESLPAKSQVFILPIFSFPERRGDDYESMIAYLHSKKLRWSYPVITGRESYLWQEKVSKLSFERFIYEIKKAGFAGIYLDRAHYAKQKGQKDLADMERKIKLFTKSSSLVSKDGRLAFFGI